MAANACQTDASIDDMTKTTTSQDVLASVQTVAIIDALRAADMQALCAAFPLPDTPQAPLDTTDASTPITDPHHLRATLMARWLSPDGQDTLLHLGAKVIPRAADFSALLLHHPALPLSLNALTPAGTALHAAATSGRAAVVAALLREPDIDDTLRDASGRTPHDLARTKEVLTVLRYHRRQFVMTTVAAMFRRCWQGDVDGLRAMFRTRRVAQLVDPNTRETALHTMPHAAAPGRPDAGQGGEGGGEGGGRRAIKGLSPRLKRLARGGRGGEERGGTLLHIAALRDDLPMIRWALSLGQHDPMASPAASGDMGGRADVGYSPMRVDPYAKNGAGKMPYEVAKSDEARRLLKEAPMTRYERVVSTKNGNAIRMEGTLSKWTNYASGYKKRWFVLEGGVLSYYKSQSDYPVACRGSIHMQVAQVQPDAHDRHRIDVIGGVGAGGLEAGMSGSGDGGGAMRYHLRAEHIAEAQRWVIALQEAKAWLLREDTVDDSEDTGKPKDSSNKLTTSSSSLLYEEGGSATLTSSASDVNLGSKAELDSRGKQPDVGDKEERARKGGGEDTEETMTAMIECALARLSQQDHLLSTFTNYLFDATPSGDAESSQQQQAPRLHPDSVTNVRKVFDAFAQTTRSISTDVRIALTHLSRHSHRERRRRTKDAKRERMVERGLRDLADEHVALQRRFSEIATGDMLAIPSGASFSNEANGHVHSPLRDAKLLISSSSGSSGSESEAEDENVGRRYSLAMSVAGDDEFFDAYEVASATMTKTMAASQETHVTAMKDESSTTSSTNDGHTEEAPHIAKGEALGDTSSKQSEKAMKDGGKEEIVPVTPEPLTLQPTILATAAGYPNPSFRQTMPPRPAMGTVSLWGILKNAIGKDLSKIALPVNFNEPISMLQRLCEDMEYVDLLSEAAKAQDALIRIQFIAAFAMSNYASTDGRTGKPFNPLLGETYEYVDAKRGWRYISEQVSHHPPISACYCESDEFVFWSEVKVNNKFWGKSIEVVPAGNSHVILKRTSEHFSWKKVTTCVHNIILGKLWIDHYGDMVVTNHATGDVCALAFKPADWRGKNTHVVEGTVRAGGAQGPIVHNILGKWTSGIDSKPARGAGSNLSLWKRNPVPSDAAKNFQFTRFAMTLNETTSGLSKEHLCATDSRLRPDQRAMEEGQYEEATAYKTALEEKQRKARKKRAATSMKAVTPRWFFQELEEDTGETHWVYKGGYWESRVEKAWENVPDIFLSRQEASAALGKKAGPSK